MRAMRLITALLASAFALSAATGEAQLLPAGKFSARDGRPGPGRQWEISDAQGVALAAAVNEIAAQTPIVIDYDHQTMRAEKNGQLAPAAGWMLSVEWRSGKGLFAKVEWTPAAKALIDAKEYRFISPVILADEDTGTVTGMLFAALLNHPGLLGMEPVVAQLAAQFTLSPNPEPSMTLLASLIAAIGIAPDAKDADVVTAVTALKAQAAKPSLPTALSTALGLTAGAGEAEALSAIGTLKTASAASDATTAQAMQALNAQISTLTAQVNGEKRTKLIGDAVKAGKLQPALVDWANKQELTALETFLAAAPVIALNGQTGGRDPGGDSGGGADVDPVEISRKAVAYQTAQAAAGISLSATEAVAHVMRAAKA